jgi:diguanylate cyclase (GGDEF)-like protein/PAS domain S-box-containing protein
MAVAEPSGEGTAVERPPGGEGAGQPSVLDALAEHVAVLNRDGVIVAANDAWRRFAQDCPADCPSATQVGASYLGAWHRVADAALARRAMDGIAAVLAGQQPRFTLEHACSTASGRRWLRISVTPLPDGAPGVAVAETDITELKRAEQRLAAQYAAGRVLSRATSFDTAAPELLERVCAALEWDVAAWWAPDADGRALSRRTVWQSPRDGAARVPAPLEPGFAAGSGIAGAVWSSGEPAWIEEPALRGDAQPLAPVTDTTPRTAFAFPIRGESGPLGVIELFTAQALPVDQALVETSQALGRQIGRAIEHARAMEALKQGRERERAHYRNLPIPTYTWERDGDDFVLVDYNEAARTLTQGAIAEMLGVRFRQEFGQVPEALAALEEALTSAGPVEREIHYRIAPANGDRTFASRFVLMPPDIVTVYLEDITERRRAEVALKQSEERFRLLAENAQDMMYRYRVDPARFDYVSPSCTTITGYTPDEFYIDPSLGRRLVHPDDLPVVLDMLSAPERIGEPLMIRWVRRDQTVIWVEQHNRATTDETGEPTIVEGIARDVTARVEAEEALRRSEERFRSLIQNASDVIAIIDADDVVRYVSPTVERVLGYLPSDLIGTSLFNALHPDDAGEVAVLLREALVEAGEHQIVEARVRHQAGDWRHLEIVASNQRDVPSIGGVVINARDITERKQFEDELAYQAFYDQLTGLPNRALFVDRMEHSLARAGRRGDRVAVMFFDLDRFKVVNDSLGHAAGDELLGAVAKRLSGLLRSSDTLARFGGDEFTVLVEDLVHPSGATGIAERIIESLRLPFMLGSHEVVISASIGIVISTDAHHKPADLLRDADIALYQAKAAGKARFVVFDPSGQAAPAARLTLETDLRRAIERGELSLVYQPEVDLDSGQIVGMEALARWQHPTRGMVPPTEFIPLAEETGLIVPIGQWILEEACRQARTWQAIHRSVPPLTMSVNLSGQQFQSPDLVGQVARVLEETGLDPSGLRLEITESVVVQDAESTVATMMALKNLGVRLAIDDFGTGYSSLSYLTRFAVDTLKVDRSFVSGVAHDQRTLSVVRAVTAMAHALGMDVTAEGIETAEQLARVRAVRCDWGQGYYFFKPVAAGVLTTILQADVA